MPRKTKDVENNQSSEIKSIIKTKKTNSNSSDKKSTTSKKSANSKTAKTKNTITKSTTSKSSSSEKVNKNSNKIDTEKKENKKSTKADAKPTPTKKTTVSKKDSKKTQPVKKDSKKDTKIASAEKTATTKKNTKETQAVKKETKKDTKIASTEKNATTKKNTKETQAVKKETKKDTKIASAKKTATTKKNTTKAPVEIFEYYDLPYRYNETIVKILAQTPKRLFVYWDISDEDRQNYIDKFGPDFFNNTKPVLIIHNKTINYTFEVEINDFANCWYLNVNDTKCDYSIELGRRSKIHDYYIPNNYIYVSSSNVIESPNDHILFENQSKTVYFRNIKNNTTHSKDIANMSFIKKMGKIYNIYDAYKKLYSEFYDDFNLDNPTSGNPTSTFK